MADKDNNKPETIAEHLPSEYKEDAGIGAATGAKMEASGAFIEDGAKKAVDVNHPAVDNNPRANTTVAQNQIDFNDPGLSEQDAVKANLEANRGE